LSWISTIWSNLQALAVGIADWFNTVGGVIVNIGQGIATGLTSLGTLLWDAIQRFGEIIADAFRSAFEAVASAFKTAYDILGRWLWQAVGWIGSGLAFIGTQLYNFGSWFAKALVWLGGQIAVLFQNLWNAIITWFRGLWRGLIETYNATAEAVNAWFTGIVRQFREKIKAVVMANVTIGVAWTGVERIVKARRMADVGFGVLGIVTAPVAGVVMAEIVNAVIPQPKTASYPLIPSLPYVEVEAPLISIPVMAEPTPPAMLTPPTIPYAPVALRQVEAVIVSEVGRILGLAPSRLRIAEIGVEVRHIIGAMVSRGVEAGVGSEISTRIIVMISRSVEVDVATEISTEILGASVEASVETEVTTTGQVIYESVEAGIGSEVSTSIG